MRQRGNARSNALYNPDTRCNPPPLDFESEERDSLLQRYIVSKYRDRAFIAPAAAAGELPRRGDQVESPSTATATTPTTATSVPPPSLREPTDKTRTSTSREARAYSPSAQTREERSTTTQTHTQIPARRSPVPDANLITSTQAPVRTAAQHQLPAVPSSHFLPPTPTPPSPGPSSSIARSMTAPIPQPGFLSAQSTGARPMSPYNPFNRSMTASVSALPTSTGSGNPSYHPASTTFTTTTNLPNPYRHQTYPSYSASLPQYNHHHQQQQQQQLQQQYSYFPHQSPTYSQQVISPSSSQQQLNPFATRLFNGSGTPQTHHHLNQQQQSGGVWDDLAGLSISSPPSSFTSPPYYTSTSPQTTLTPSTTSSSSSSYPSTPSTNPFLRTPSTLSVLSPGSSAATAAVHLPHPPRFQPTSDFGKALAAAHTASPPPPPLLATTTQHQHVVSTVMHSSTPVTPVSQQQQQYQYHNPYVQQLQGQ